MREPPLPDARSQWWQRGGSPSMGAAIGTAVAILAFLAGGAWLLTTCGGNNVTLSAQPSEVAPGSAVTLSAEVPDGSGCEGSVAFPVASGVTEVRLPRQSAPDGRVEWAITVPADAMSGGSASVRVRCSVGRASSSGEMVLPVR